MRYLPQFRRLGSMEFENDPPNWNDQEHAQMYVMRVVKRCHVYASGQVLDTLTRKVVYFYDRYNGERDLTNV